MAPGVNCDERKARQRTGGKSVKGGTHTE